MSALFLGRVGWVGMGWDERTSMVKDTLLGCEYSAPRPYACCLFRLFMHVHSFSLCMCLCVSIRTCIFESVSFPRSHRLYPSVCSALIFRIQPLCGWMLFFLYIKVTFGFYCNFPSHIRARDFTSNCVLGLFILHIGLTELPFAT